jgi:NAD(P)-dependent dehydrogenase (short-subunit alcohol dehydrogenase family)
MTEATPGTVLITGAGLRIGRAIALDLARDDWSVAVHYHRSDEAAREVVTEIAAGGGRAAAFAADFSDEAQTEALVPHCAGELGPLTCLVNNASLFEDDRFETVTRDSWDAHLAVNLRAPMVLIQAFARQLPAAASGNVINMLDQRVWNLGPGFVSYTVSKAGLWTLTRTLALALAPRVRVNGIGPGPALPSRRQSEVQFANQCARMPLERGTTPEEICGAVRFILAAPAMTGQMIALDGGEHLGRAGKQTGKGSGA